MANTGNAKDDQLRKAIREQILAHPNVKISDRFIADRVKEVSGPCGKNTVKKVRLKMVADGTLGVEHRERYRGSKRPGRGGYTSAGAGSVVNPHDGEVITEMELLRRMQATEAVFVSPDEVASEATLSEGAVCTVTVNAYERDREARRQCIVAHGTTCCICGFNFGAVYGPEAEGYIHAHHLRPLSESGGRHVVNPVEDMRPVCPNCHAVLHLGGKCRTVEEVRQMLAGHSSDARPD